MVAFCGSWRWIIETLEQDWEQQLQLCKRSRYQHSILQYVVHVLFLILQKQKFVDLVANIQMACPQFHVYGHGATCQVRKLGHKRSVDYLIIFEC